MKKKNGKSPSLGSIADAAANYWEEKGAVGRPQGSRGTTKQDDGVLLKTFKKMRNGCEL